MRLDGPRVLRSVAWLALVGVTGTVVATQCRSRKTARESPEGSQAAAPAAESASGESPAESAEPEAEDDEEIAGVIGEAGVRPTRRSGPKAGAQGEGKVDPACIGAQLTFEGIVADPRCATTQRVSKELLGKFASDGGRAPALRQEARRDGDRVVVALVNGGPNELTLPLSWHESLPAFSVVAEDERHALYELKPPALDVRGKDDAAVPARAYIARIVLPPGGRATGRFVVDPTVERRLDRRCPPDAGEACTPPKLAKGKYVLHVGQLVSDVEELTPAKVDWELR